MRAMMRRSIVPAILGIPLLLGSLPRAEAQDQLINKGDLWKFFRGIEEPPQDWNTVGFDDSAWEEGVSGFGYGDNDDATVLNDMRNNYLSVYIRKEIEIADPDAFDLLQLGIDYDDGYVAYFNGVEISRAGLTGQPPAFDATSGSHERTGAPQWISFPSAVMSAVRAGPNVLALQGHNTNLTSSDLTLIPQLRGFATICPTSVTCTERPDGSIRLIWRTPIRPPPYDEVEIYRNGELIGNPTRPTSQTFTDRDVPPGRNVYTVVAIIDGESCTGDGVPSCSTEPVGAGFRRGDADDNGRVNLTDAIFMLNGLFRGGTQPTCMDTADVDDTGKVNLTDAVFLLIHLFQGGPPPPDPGTADCGPDATSEDPLTDCTYTSC